MRIDQRKSDELRPVSIQPGITRYAEGSVLISSGDTKVICTATVEPQAPKWLQGTQKGWITAEYSMLPRSTHERVRRDKAMSSGRSQEISRLIGRALRSGIDLYGIAERQIIIDCDVMQADGGTRTAAITGSFIALMIALNNMKSRGVIQKIPFKNFIAATSVGLSKDGPLLDLNYIEDSQIETDMNFVMNDKSEFIEIQGTAEGQAFTAQQFTALLPFATKGCGELIAIQKSALRELNIEWSV